MPVSIALMQATDSMAPEAPSAWPIIDFVELTGMLVGALAEDALDRGRLGGVVGRRRGAVGVDVVDVVRRQAGVVERQADGALGAFAVDAGRDDVVGVRAGAVAGELGEDAGAAALGVLQRLEDEDAGALGADEAVAVGVEGTAGLRRVVGAGREGAHDVEAGEAQLADAGLAAAGDHDVGAAEADDVERRRRSPGCRRRRPWSRCCCSP